MALGREAAERQEQAVLELMALDEGALLAELGARAHSMSEDESAAGEVAAVKSADVELEGVVDTLSILGVRIFNRLNREAHSLICGSDATDDADRQSILRAAGIGPAALAPALAGALVSGLGIAPAIAAVVAALLIKRVFEPAGEEICKYWGEQLA